MSLPHALLTSLQEKASSGYELARRFDRSIGHFWHATHQQIYRELGRMEAAGWIAPEPEGRPGMKSYRVLEAGREELARWSRQPSTQQDLREDLLIKLRAEAIIGPLGLEAELARRLAEHQAALQLYREIERRDFLGKPTSRERLMQHLVLKAGLAREEAWVKWASEALAALSEEGLTANNADLRG